MGESAGGPQTTDSPAEGEAQVRKAPRRGNAVVIACVAVVAASLAVVFLVSPLGPFDVAGSSEPATDEVSSTAATTIAATTEEALTVVGSSQPPSSPATSSSATSPAAASSSSTSSTTTRAFADPYTTDHLYTNQEFGFKVTIPAGFYRAMSASDNAIFFNDSGMNISVYGENNTTGMTDKDYLSRFLGGSVAEYQATDNGMFAGSYYTDSGSTVAYFKGYCGSGSMCVVSMSYPASDSSTCDAIVEKVSPSFTPGDVSRKH
jgi:hypothetical protein